jgi:hypothetical protein
MMGSLYRLRIARRLSMFAGEVRAEAHLPLTEKVCLAIAACRSRPSLQTPAIEVFIGQGHSVARRRSRGISPDLPACAA